MTDQPWVRKPKVDFDNTSKTLGIIGEKAMSLLPANLIGDPRMKAVITDIHHLVDKNFPEVNKEDNAMLRVMFCAMWAQSLIEKIKVEWKLMFNEKGETK